MENKKVKIELDKEEAEFFKWCWKNFKELYNMWKELRPGKSINHLDSGGNIKKSELYPVDKSKK